MTERDLILKLTDALQETRVLAAQLYNEEPPPDTSLGTLAQAREAIEIGEEYRADPEALKGYL